MRSKLFIISICILMLYTLNACSDDSDMQQNEGRKAPIETASDKLDNENNITNTDEPNGIIISTQSKILHIDRDNKVKLLYNGKNVTLDYQSGELFFLKYIDDNKYKICSIKLSEDDCKELSGEFVSRFDFDSGTWTLFNDNDSVIFRINSKGLNTNSFIDKIGSRVNESEPINRFEYKDWIYYTDTSDENKIYRNSKDGKTSEKLNNENSGIIAILNDNIFYENDQTGDLIKIDLDGSNKVMLSNRQAFLSRIGDYYMDIVPLYELLFIHQDNIYFNVIYPDGGSGTLLIFAKACLDGGGVEVLGSLGADNFTIVDNWAYYQDAGPFLKEGLRRINLLTGKIELLDNINYKQITDYRIVGKSILYIAGTEIFKMDLDGLEKVRLCNTDKLDRISNCYLQ